MVRASGICLEGPGFNPQSGHLFCLTFWVDDSSLESLEMSLRGISSIPATRDSSVDGSVESVLQWISYIQEEWLIVFDNADNPLP